MLSNGMRLEAAPAEVSELEELAFRDFRKYTARAYRYLGNVDDAEDAVQEALLSAFTHLSEFKNRAKLSTWVTSIVMNAARMQRRRRKPNLSYDELLEYLENPELVAKIAQDKRPTPENICAGNELLGLVLEMIHHLSPACRIAIDVYLLQGLDTAAASKFLGVPITTYKSQLSRARKQLKQRLAAKLRLLESPDTPIEDRYRTGSCCGCGFQNPKGPRSARGAGAAIRDAPGWRGRLITDV
jgi:RNA polymerase sigma-70 factor (ECF subfamily)